MASNHKSKITRFKSPITNHQSQNNHSSPITNHKMTELLPTLRLAGPVVLAEIGWMSMGIVDTIMVGPLGPAAIGAAGMSNSLFFAVAVFGMGVMLGLDALVAKSYGAGRLDDCVRWLQHGVLVALVVAPTIMVIFYGALTTSTHWGLHPAVRALAQP